jgi:nitroimidazol reductase NimA-like FMN-containing flavoprotein (pyridoxamine 5'-phosphate oxidase superfamily)
MIGSLQEKERAMSFTWSPSVAMSREEMDHLLQQKLVARLSSIRPDGYPHTTPLWYVWDSEALWFEIGAGERPRQHLRNLLSNPKLCVMIDRDARPEQGGVFDAQGVLIRGTVELSTDEMLQEEVSRTVLRRYLGDEGERYLDDMLQDGKPGKNRVVAKVIPEHISGWDFRKLPGADGSSTA